MKIVHLVDYLMPTMGYQEFLLPKWNSLQGVDTTIVCSDRFYPVPNYNDTWHRFLGPRICGPGVSKIEGVNIVRLPVLFEIMKRPFMRGLSDTIKELKPDVLMCHGTGSFTAVRAAHISARQNIPILYDNHMIMGIIQQGFLQSFYYWILRSFVSFYISRRAFRVFGVTIETCDYLSKIEKYPARLIEHLPLAIDSSIFYFDSTSSPEFLSIDQSFKIVQPGKLNDDKKPTWLATAVVELLKRGRSIDLQFIGAGDPKLISQINTMFSKSGFSRNLTFTPLRPLAELARAYRNSNFVIFPDGTSLSALEAAACGCVVIMANHPASVDRANKGIGVTYRRGDISDLVEVIDRLLHSPSECRAIQERSVKAVASIYTYEAVSREFLRTCAKASELSVHSLVGFNK